MTEFPLGALILPEPAAEEAWQGWRAALDIDALTYESQQLLPALGARLAGWLEQDEAAACFRGIVKMTWSRNQVRLRIAAEARQTLVRGRVEPVLMAGPAAWSLSTRDEGAIRFIPHLSLLISRGDAAKAASALAADGWNFPGEPPQGDALDRHSHIVLTKGEDSLHLHWRLLAASAGDAAACERACVESPRSVEWNQRRLPAPSAEMDLLHRLSARPHWDPVPWQADVLMMPFDAVEWTRFRTLALRFAPDAVPKLMSLRRDFQLPIPEILPPHRRPLSRTMAVAAAGRARFVRVLRRVSGRGRILWKS